MQNIDLSVQYAQAEGAVREHVRSVAALAHLPPADILQGWLALMGECPIDVHPQLENFNDYFVETWLADDAKIPVGIWNVVNQRFIAQFKQELKTAQHDAAVQPARKKKKYIVVNQRLAQFKQEYANGERSLLRFLHAAGHLLKLEYTVSDIKVPTQNNNCPIQNIYYLNYTLTINNYHYMSYCQEIMINSYNGNLF